MKKNLMIGALALVSVNANAQVEGNNLPEIGRVGIGTTEPTEKLDVRGGANIDSTLTVGDSIVISNSARVGEDLTVSGNCYISGRMSVDGPTGLNQAEVNQRLMLNYLANPSSNPQEVLLVDPAGKVSRSGDLKSLIYGTTLPMELPCAVDAQGNIVSPLPVWQNSPDLMVIASANCIPNLKVGIGTTSPAQRLHVSGRTFTSSLYVGGQPALANQTAYSQFYFKTSGLSSSSAAPIFIVENSSKRLMQLNNDGLLYAREIKVNLDSAWPDYVFKKNYSLMPLDELQGYINQNGHLPNVPDASSIEKDGINVAETDKMLMEKVEELTLYLLQLKEQINKQAQEITDLKSQLNSK